MRNKICMNCVFITPHQAPLIPLANSLSNSLFLFFLQKNTLHPNSTAITPPPLHSIISLQSNHTLPEPKNQREGRNQKRRREEEERERLPNFSIFLQSPRRAKNLSKSTTRSVSFSRASPYFYFNILSPVAPAKARRS